VGVNAGVAAFHRVHVDRAGQDVVQVGVAWISVDINLGAHLSTWERS
jgi:hypothetical protein